MFCKIREGSMYWVRRVGLCAAVWGVAVGEPLAGGRLSACVSTDTGPSLHYTQKKLVPVEAGLLPWTCRVWWSGVGGG